MPLPVQAARDTARKEFTKRLATALVLKTGYCANTYGVSPCTATGAAGTECYNVYPGCQDKANFTATIKTIKFISRGADIPPGELIRPYIKANIDDNPTIIDPDKGLAPRGEVRLTLVDEPCDDYQFDPYYATRAKAAGGTFWSRWLTRNPNYFRRDAELHRGYVVSPFDWNSLLQADYLIRSIDGPNGDNTVAITLKDPLSYTERKLVPAPTNGALTEDLKAVEFEGTATAGGTDTITLPSDASAIDDFYNDMSAQIPSGTGAGQEQTITDYVGATRVATVTTNWSVQPDNTSGVKVGKLKVGVGAGLAAQYNTYGVPCRVAIGEETIIVDAVDTGADELSWTTLDNRGVDGELASDHSTGDNVQLCKRIEAKNPVEIIQDYCEESGIATAKIDVTGMAAEADTWMNQQAEITITRRKPEAADKVIATISLLAGGATWWDPYNQLVKFKVIAPDEPGIDNIHVTDTNGLIEKSIKIRRRNDLQRTRAAVYYDPKSQARDLKRAENYLRAALLVDADAEDTNMYGSEIGTVIAAEWLAAANELFITAWLLRYIAARSDVPIELDCKIDPKDYDVSAGDMLDISTSKLPNSDDGHAVKTKVLVMRTKDRGGHIEMKTRVMNFSNHPWWFADGSAGDWPNDPDYAHFSDSNGLLPDGSPGHMFI